MPPDGSARVKLTLSSVGTVARCPVIRNEQIMHDYFQTAAHGEIGVCVRLHPNYWTDRPGETELGSVVSLDRIERVSKKYLAPFVPDLSPCKRCQVNMYAFEPQKILRKASVITHLCNWGF